ncbi:MAG: tRNA 2-thiocytidine biosynthesis TtcA family protein [Oscillospiraceae bacterium]
MELNRFTGYVRRCADDYGMLSPGDRVAVGVSGGKDSMALLAALGYLRRYHPSRFELRAITIDMGFEGMDFAEVGRLCADMEVPYTIVKTDIREVVFDIRKEENPCSLCSKMRRGALNDAIKSLGCNKLALGHHFDDAVETFLMSLVFEGRLSCFKPVTHMSRAEVTQIRPLLYLGEESIRDTVAELSLPLVPTTCPQDRESKRAEIKALVAGLSETYPDLKHKIFGAMQRLPLSGWGINEKTDAQAGEGQK